MKYETFRKLTTSYPFIYLINGEYYVIGGCIFKECSPKQIAMYNAFADEYKNVDPITHNTEGKELKRLFELFDSIVLSFSTECDNSKTCEMTNDVKNRLWEFVKHLSDDQCNDISNQRKVFGKVSCWKDHYSLKID